MMQHATQVKSIAKTNVILVIIVILLSLIAWYQPGLHKTVLQYLSSLNVKEINTIILERRDIGSIKLKKYQNGWFLQEPYQLPANPQRVNTVTALARKRSYSQFKANESDLARYHLANPLVSIWFNERKFAIGSEDPINRQRYAMDINDNILSGNNTIHLINGAIFYQLRANLDTFISPALLPPQSSIKRIIWADKNLTIANGRWQLTPESPGTPSDSIAQFIQYWQQTQASRVETNVSLSITNAELLKSPSIKISFSPFGSTDSTIDTIHYLIIQDGEKIKLLRTDIQVAYWISPQILKNITEFLPSELSKK